MSKVNKQARLEIDRREAMAAAMQLGYDTRFPNVMRELKEAKTSDRVSIIMATYRRKDW